MPRGVLIDIVAVTLSDDAEAIEASIVHGLTAYDAAYLVLGRNWNVPLATADKSLARATSEAGTSS